MTSSWGNSWGVAWGNSWGSVEEAENDLVLLGCGPGRPHYATTGNNVFRIKDIEYERRKRELKLLEIKLAEKEKQELILSAQIAEKAISNQNNELIRELRLLEAQAQEEIRKTLALRSELIRLMRDEEDTMILLLSLPFVH